MLAGLVILGVVLFYVNNRAPAAVVTTEAPEVLDALDTSRYRTEAAVDMTIDY